MDSLAHKAALSIGGRSIGVLGSGLDRIYPQENVGLSTALIEKGALISEFPMGTAPDRGNFPQRNRII
ncbi:DNA-protecting protein DprA, partial [Candidatus Marinimicrobia bacterium MT.SAG.2]